MNDSTKPVPQWSTTTMQRVGDEPTLGAAAVRYANLGIPVFPCVPGFKQPLTSNGFHDATSSARTVHHWWQRNPNANIGMPTGGVTGVVVVDVDVHAEVSGFEAFERARTDGLADGWGWFVRTPSGGLHAYYPTADIEQRSWQAPSALVDFRGDGGYVIAPPSRLTLDGRPASYVVIATATGASHSIDSLKLRQFLEPPRQLPPRINAPTIGSRPDRLAEWVASRPEGGRNAGLFWAACRMVEQGHDVHDAIGVLGEAARTAGLEDREVETTIQSAYRIASRLSGAGSASRPGPIRPVEVVGR